jgi:hypothetical protein
MKMPMCKEEVKYENANAKRKSIWKCQCEEEVKYENVKAKRKFKNIVY